METIITCQQISKTWGTAPLFKGLSLGFGTNEKTGLTGSNGTGKSTLLKILAGSNTLDFG